MNEYYTFRVRLLNGTTQYIRTKNASLSEGDVIKYITTNHGKESYHVGIIECQHVENGASRFAKVAMPLTNVGSLNSYKKIENCPYYLASAFVNIDLIDEDFRRRHHVMIAEDVSLEIGFGYENETAEILKGYHSFSEGAVLAMLYCDLTNSCIVFIRNEAEDDTGIDEIHFNISSEMNAIEIASNHHYCSMNEVMFAAFTLAVSTDLRGASFMVINDKLYHSLNESFGKSVDDSDYHEDDFEAICTIFSRRMHP